MSIILLLLLFALVCYYYFAFIRKTVANPNHPDDQDLRNRYRFDLKPASEKPVQIEKLWIYPCRGIKGIEVDHVKVSKYGIKYDREWSVYYKEKLSPITLSPEIKFSLLRQRIERDPSSKHKFLIISIVESHKEEAAKLPSKELKVLIRKQVEGEIIETPKGNGVSEGPEADKWFSEFLGKDVFLLRSAPNFKKPVPKKSLRQSLEGDLTKGFVSKAAIHIVNEASVRDLKERVLKKFTDPEQIAKIKIESMPFRPNFIIDTKVPYSEDSYKEARVGNTLLRLVGYSSRCKAVTCNFDTNERNPDFEPIGTLNEYRKHEYGTLFGTYHQAEIIGSQAQFMRLMPEFIVPRNRKIDSEYGIICRGDMLMIRVDEQIITFDPEKQDKKVNE